MEKGSAHDYQKLDVWKRSIELVVIIYKITENLPNSEKYALCDQLKRAAVSIPSNIAEGQKRYSNKDTIHFCTIALGSLAEVETQLILISRIYNLETQPELEECAIISRMLHALIKSLRAKN